MRFFGAVLCLVAWPFSAGAFSDNDPELLVLEQLGDRCQWNRVAIPGAQVRAEVRTQVRTVLRTRICPDQAVWTPRAGRVYFNAGDRVYTAPWGHPGPVQALPALPLGAASLTWLDLWFDRDSGRLRVGFLLETACSGRDICRYALGGERFETRRNRAGEESFVLENGLPRPPKEGEDAVTLPTFGAEALAVVLDLDPGDGWRRIAAAPTRDEAADTPGLEILWRHLARDPQSWDLRTAQASGSCLAMRETDRGCYPADRVSAEVLAAFAELAPESGAEDGSDLGYLPAGDDGFLFRVTWGDTPHIEFPVFTCRRRCDQAYPLEISTELRDHPLTLSLSPGGRYLLVAAETGPSVAQVFQLSPASSDGRAVANFSRPASIVWLPRNMPGSR